MGGGGGGHWGYLVNKGLTMNLFDIFPIMNNDVNKISTLAGLVTLTQGSTYS